MNQEGPYQLFVWPDFVKIERLTNDARGLEAILYQSKKMHQFTCESVLLS